MASGEALARIKTCRLKVEVSASLYLTDGYPSEFGRLGIVHLKKPAPRLIDLGEDLLEATDGGCPEEITLDGRSYCRFMDRLYLPRSTLDLSLKQIELINRFRERNFDNDPQFGYNRVVREIFSSLVERIAPRTVLEIGPGFNPITVPKSSKYTAIDIDAKVVSDLADKAFVVGDWSALDSIPSGSIDLVVSCFVFHFDVTEAQIYALDRVVSRDGAILFNVLSKDAQVRTAQIAKLSKVGFSSFAVDMRDKLGKTDIIYLSHRDRSPIDWVAHLSSLLSS